MPPKTDGGHPQVRLTADLIPTLVDKRAALTPHNVYAEYPFSPHTYDQGYRRILFTDLANAVNGIAWWLHQTLGPSHNFETLAYIGPNDIRYPAIILGAVKAGYTIFLTSPRNSLAAHASLFKCLNCTTILSPATRSPAIDDIEKEGLGRVVEVPEVDHLLNITHPPYPFDKTLPDARQEPLFIVSGAYLVSFLFNAIPFGTTLIAPISGAIPTAEGLVAGLKKTPADVAIIVPSILQELGENPDLLEYCSQNLKAILYCGGDLPQAIGDTVASKIKLVNQFGATELGLTPNLLSSQGRSIEDWKYVQFHPDLGLNMRPTADDTFELYAIRDDSLRETQPTFTIFPDAQEYASRDLFVRHPCPSKKDLWKWKARADDIIVFLNGEKTNPISMEQHIISSNVEVAAVLVIGAQRFQAGLLVELVANKQGLTSTERAQQIEKLWPTVAEANRDAPSHARITKSQILFTSPQKSMMRAGKGTVQRAGTLQAYQYEIEALYRDADQMSAESDAQAVIRLETADEISLLRYIKETITSITGWAKVSDTEHIFAAGMDSLHGILLVRTLRRALGIPDLAPSTVYTNDSPTALTQAILAMRSQQLESKGSQEKNRLSKREELLQKYTRKIDQLLPVPLPPSASSATPSRIIVLTGSTGALGSYILHSLLADSTVNHVYCLNRAVESHCLQQTRNTYRQIPTDLSTDRVTFYTCDLSSSDLGLPADVYQMLVESDLTVVHCAWPVNFILAIDAFRPQLDSVVNLVGLVSKSKRPSRLFFVSSISSVMSYQSPTSSIPELTIEMESTLHPNGYAESKYLSELLLQHASRRLSVNCSVARVGQLAGAAQGFGAWNPAEWFPSLVISSSHISALPSSLGSSFDDMNWIPIDLAAEVIVDIAVTRQQPVPHDNDDDAGANPSLTKVYHLINPRSVHWQSMRSSVARTISHFTSKPVEIVDPSTWIVKVRDNLEKAVTEKAGSQKQGLDKALKLNPAAKLLDFYNEIMRSSDTPGVKWELEKTLARSEHLRDLASLQDAWIEKWVSEWLHALNSARL
ncbi:MAG: hypothetical protein L6R38_001622 [Xanthoria sp. 2 TBL-2021]|nr:MAG: hypothetical protein L6R38_001622 [Xanthoria sp. 2 TBL-2021]